MVCSANTGWLGVNVARSPVASVSKPRNGAPDKVAPVKILAMGHVAMHA
ncbi:MAG: hypothetical protein ACI9W2_003648 [Gammaproteobacteria bacterium]|jgi:hypothetical protein